MEMKIVFKNADSQTLSIRGSIRIDGYRARQTQMYTVVNDIDMFIEIRTLKKKPKKRRKIHLGVAIDQSSANHVG